MKYSCDVALVIAAALLLPVKSKKDIANSMTRREAPKKTDLRDYLTSNVGMGILQ